MTNEAPSPKTKKFDLEDRTASFGIEIIRLAKRVPETVITKPLISQIIRSGTSIGANYMEADVAESKKDFIHKIKLCKKEAKETLHWLRMLAEVAPKEKEACRKLWKEASELVRIFGAISKPKA